MPAVLDVPSYLSYLFLTSGWYGLFIDNFLKIDLTTDSVLPFEPDSIGAYTFPSPPEYVFQVLYRQSTIDQDPVLNAWDLFFQPVQWIFTTEPGSPEFLTGFGVSDISGFLLWHCQWDTAVQIHAGTVINLLPECLGLWDYL